MATGVPSEIQVIESDTGVRYVLPRRASGVGRVAGLSLAVFGLVLAGVGVWFFAEAARNAAGDGPGAVVLLLPGIMALGLVALGGLVSLVGMWLRAGNSEIEVTAEEIVGAFRLGPLAWRGRRPQRAVRRLVVERLSREPGDDTASLAAETDAGRQLLLAPFYPADWLTGLAGDLAGRWSSGEPTPAVVVREGRRAASLGWRRERPAGALGRMSGCFLVVWGLGFLAAGIFTLVMIWPALLQGDPGNNLQGDFPWKWLWGLFPFPFIIPGALALVFTWRRRTGAGTSPEHAAAAAVGTAPEGGEAGGPVPPAEEYPTVPEVGHRTGTDLAVRLGESLGGGCTVLLALAGVLVCSGIVTPLFVHVAGRLRAGVWDQGLFVAGFFSLFLGLAWLTVTGFLVRQWRLWRLGEPAVEASAWPLTCGEECEILVTVPGPALYRRLRVVAVCEEEASYTVGTDTRKETRRVYEQELAAEEGLAVEREQPWQVRVRFRPPVQGMHSLQTAHNEVRWLVRVEGEAVRLFRLPFTRDYRLAVRPPRGDEEVS